MIFGSLVLSRALFWDITSFLWSLILVLVIQTWHTNTHWGKQNEICCEHADTSSHGQKDVLGKQSTEWRYNTTFLADPKTKGLCSRTFFSPLESVNIGLRKQQKFVISRRQLSSVMCYILICLACLPPLDDTRFYMKAPTTRLPCVTVVLIFSHPIAI